MTSFITQKVFKLSIQIFLSEGKGEGRVSCAGYSGEFISLAADFNSSFHKYQAAEATITKGKANEAAIQARKRPCTSADHAFMDSPFTIAGMCLLVSYAMRC